MKNILKITALTLALSATVIAPANASAETDNIVELPVIPVGGEENFAPSLKPDNYYKEQAIKTEPIKQSEEEIKDIISKYINIEEEDKEVQDKKIKEIKFLLEHEGLINEARKDGIKGLLKANTKEDIEKALANFNPQGPIEEYPLTEDNYNLTKTDNGYTFKVKGNQFETDKEGVLALDRNYSEDIPREGLIDSERNALIGKYIVNKADLNLISQAIIENIIEYKDLKLENILDTHITLNEEVEVIKDNSILKETKDKFVKEIDNEKDKEGDTTNQEEQDKEKDKEEIEKYREEKINLIKQLTLSEAIKDKYINDINNADTKDKIDEIYNLAINDKEEDNKDKDNKNNEDNKDNEDNKEEEINKLRENKIAEINKLNLSQDKKDNYISQIKTLTEESEMNKIVESAKQEVVKNDNKVNQNVVIKEKDNKKEELKQLKDNYIKQINALNISDVSKQRYTSDINLSDNKDKMEEVLNKAKEESKIQSLKDEKIKQIQSLKNLSDEEKKMYTDRINKASTEDDINKAYDNAERVNNLNDDDMVIKDTVAGDDVKTGVTGLTSITAVLATATMAYTANKKKNK